MKIDWGTIGIEELAALVSEKLRQAGISAILVGGACVSIYTKNEYQSYDLDFVSYAEMKKIEHTLTQLGFTRESSRHFIHPDCPFFIEFVTPPPAVGREPLKGEERLRTSFGTLILMTPTDSVKDRLAAYFHWNDRQALEQALMVTQVQKVDLDEVKRWAAGEGAEEGFALFLERAKKFKSERRKKGNKKSHRA